MTTTKILRFTNEDYADFPEEFLQLLLKNVPLYM
jgi:hypothetical protein